MEQQWEQHWVCQQLVLEASSVQDRVLDRVLDAPSSQQNRAPQQQHRAPQQRVQQWVQQRGKHVPRSPPPVHRHLHLQSQGLRRGGRDRRKRQLTRGYVESLPEA